MKLRNIATALALGAVLAASAQSPKYIFLYVGDGMGMGPVNAAETYNRMVLRDSEPLLMNTFPVVGWCQTYSASAPVTDSAAAGTAFSTGAKTRNGMLGMNPDTVAVNSVAADLFAAGWGVGIATSVAADDATPGAFYAHVPYRKMYAAIDSAFAVSGYQYLAGAGLQGLAAADGNPTAAARAFTAEGITVVRGPENAMTPVAGRKVLLNPEGSAPWNISYTIDSVSGVLSLPLIAESCLAHLQATSPDRFFVMIEGGNIDHALHANDGGAAVKEILNFNDALAVAFDFYKAHPDETLIIVTADHDTGGMALGWNAISGIGNIDYQRVSKEQFSTYCKSLLRDRRIYRWDDMKEYLRENLGLYGPIAVGQQQDERLRNLFDATFELRNTADQETLYANFNAFAVEVFKIFNDAAGFAFTTTGHSGNPVPLYAVGCGADLFKGFNNNIDIAARIRAIAGLSR